MVVKLGMILIKNNPMKKEYNFTIKYQLLKAFPDKDPIWMARVFNSKGEYIGSIKDLEKLLDKGIIPEVIPQHKNNKEANGGLGSTCSIGKSVINGKWYGWSHRAIYGFEIGDKVKKGDCCASSGWTDEYLKDHPEENLSLPIGFVAKTEKDTKKMAIAFAESVS